MSTMSLYTILALSVFLIQTVISALDDPVAFQAIKGATNKQYVSFQAMVLNNKAKFNPHFGVFECESPGIYLFSFNVLSNKNAEIRLSLRINRIPILTVYAGSKTSYNSASGTTLLSLSEKDIVYLFIEKGVIYESNEVNRAYTSFSGVQLSETQGGGFFSSLIGRGLHNEPILFGISSQGDKGGLVAEQDGKDKIFEHLKKSGEN